MKSRLECKTFEFARFFPRRFYKLKIIKYEIDYLSSWLAIRLLAYYNIQHMLYI